METRLPEVPSLKGSIPSNREPEHPTTTLDMRAPSRVVRRAATESCSDPNMCEKPISQKDLALPIALGIIIPLVAVICVLVFLHRRNVKKMRKEDLDDPNADLDFGMGDKPSTVSKVRRSIFGEKGGVHKNQLSMDMNMSTPYLLPPQTQQSSETLHTLAHSVQTPEDRYKPVDHFGGSDVGSIRSARRGPGGDQASLYTTTSRRDMRSPTGTDFTRPPPAAADPYGRRSPSSPQSPISRSDSFPISPAESRADPFMAPSEMHQPHTQYSAHSGNNGAAAQPPKIEIPVSAMPPTIDVAHSPQERESPTSASAAQPMTAKIETAETADSLPAHPEPQQGQIGDVRDRTSSAAGFTSPPLSPPPRNAARQGPSLHAETASAHNSTYSGYDQPPSQRQNNDDYGEPRGRPRSRFPNEAPRASQFLAAPQTENKRLSVGFRPLPPDEIMDTEDPERRASRIRSFYKEYFEADSPEDQPPLPGPIPAALTQPQAPSPQPQPQPSTQPPPQSKAEDYYEDYDEEYLENTYVDPGSKSFVMPYAQPVHRRAMTPPPARGPRMRGPPPARVMHGSMGGISLPGSHIRSGSATSSRLGPRPDSSASARVGPRGRPRAPPPALTTLPNPAKLGDDTFALMSASEFAPPNTFKERTQGRSQSPMPEKRPYKLGVPIVSPLASSYDDLAAIPSPHMLRKSGTFTALDFAPPRRFKDDGDVMSDAGSIRSARSNRSGISAVKDAALRQGAGRVSRLPGDTVFTQAELGEQLRPTWNMRS